MYKALTLVFIFFVTAPILAMEVEQEVQESELKKQKIKPVKPEEAQLLEILQSIQAQPLRGSVERIMNRRKKRARSQTTYINFIVFRPNNNESDS